MVGKKILILGNGFDLAHNLLTRYENFLEYYKKYYIHKECRKDNEEIYYKLDYYLKYNVWHNYFQEIYNNKMIKRENWIDFESEISFIISFLDKFTENLSRKYLDLRRKLNDDKNDNSIRLKNFEVALSKALNKDLRKALRKALKINKVLNNETIKDVRKRCYDDLERLIKALEIYFLEVVEKEYTKTKRLKVIENIHADSIISFNYTHTYERLYNDRIPVFHIHGECGKKENNMVLGIDEYWSEKECDKHTNYAIFKKFVQRIRKKTGTIHIKWLNEINNIYQTKNEMSDIYVFGHSLDITDKDILKEFFTSEATRIHIYCKDAETEGELIANVIKLMGEENLLQKVNQELPKIEFILQ